MEKNPDARRFPAGILRRFREALMKSAAVDGERFSANPAVGDLFRGSLENVFNRRQLHLPDMLDGKAQLRAAGKKIVAVFQHSVLAQSGEAL